MNRHPNRQCKEYESPKFAHWLLEQIVKREYQYSVLGDFEEIFSQMARESGRTRANFWYWWQVITSIPPFLIDSIYWSIAMFSNYVKITIRNLVRQKIYSTINIVGLAVGMACFIIISLWVRDELSYDQFHENKDRIFRAITLNSGELPVVSNTSYALGPAMKEKYPEVADYARVHPWGASLVKSGEKRFMEENLYLADPALFTMFSFPFVKGAPETALPDKNSIVITEETARRYFGNESPLGKILHLMRYQANFVVTGVIRNIPRNSHLRFDLLIHIDWIGKRRLESWEWSGPTYVMLAENVSPDAMNRKIAGFCREVFSEEVSDVLALQPLTRVHLYETGAPGIIKQVYIFSFIAVLILFIACINFMNLTTARSTKRAKEVGMRKVSGATQIQLIKQFLGEALLLSLLAFALAVIMAELFLPAFNQFAGKELSLFAETDLTFIAGLFGVALVTGIVSGSYPAFVMSSMQPVSVLKANFQKPTAFGKKSVKAASLRKVLVVSQFAISIGLIISTIVVHKQLRFIQEKDLGLNREQIVSVPLPPEPGFLDHFDAMKNMLLSDPNILRVTASMNQPTDVGTMIEINWQGNPNESLQPVWYSTVDYDYFETFEMELVAGRGFSKEFATDEKEACVINETAMKTIGVENPVGTQIYFNHPAMPDSMRNLTIVGVVKDFHYRSMHEEIKPFVFRMYRPWHGYLFLKIRPEKMQNTLARIEQMAGKIAPDYQFRYEFLDEAFERQYLTEVKLGQLFNIFGVLAIVISCLGLLGLTAFTTERRTKEIAVRKVLGASESRIVLLLSKEFLKAVLLANLIAWPVAWIAMNGWLQEFAYRINIGLETFAIAGMATLAIAMLTISALSIKAAHRNPVDCLNYE